jgi:hypothetical protein
MVTNNVRVCPYTTLPRLSIEVIRLDDFLLDIFDLAPEEFAAVIREQVNDAMRPPLSPTDVSAILPLRVFPRLPLRFDRFSSEANVDLGAHRTMGDPLPPFLRI